jgi:hypothetical protein
VQLGPRSPRDAVLTVGSRQVTIPQMLRSNGLPFQLNVTKAVYTALAWGALGLLAHAIWQLGPRTMFGRALVGGIFPLLIVNARLTHKARWRLSLHQTLSFCVPACTFFLLVELLYLGTAHTSLGLAEKLYLLLDAIAEFLYQNAISTGLGLLVLVCSYRASSPAVERRTYVAATMAILLATLSVTAVCALAYHGLMAM